MDPQSEGRDVASVLAGFAQLLAREHGVQDVLDTLGELCAELLPVDGIGVLLLVEGELEVASASNEEAAAIERLEAELCEGPCSVAARTGIQVLAPDLDEHVERWPTFVPAARSAGIRSVHALPMSVRGAVVGALDIVAETPVALSQEQLDVAQLLADVAIAYIVNTQLRDERTQLAEQLQQALDSRVVIEQAKGSLAERHGEPVEAAFERLRRHARDHNTKLRVVAEQVLRGDAHP